MGIWSSENAALEALAYKHFKIPLAVFYFPEPPSLDDPKKAFRRLPEFELERFSPNTLQTVRIAQAYQDSLVELAPESAERRRIFRNLKLTTNNVKSIASDARHYLGVSLSRQFEFASAETAFKVWRHALEGAGIFTFKDALRDKFISGFSLQHDSYPIIFVNNSNAHERQIFTLFHELGHLLFGISGVTDVNETYINFMSSNERLVEIKCNEFAGEVLLPDQAFKHDVSRLDRARIETLIPKLARKYSVSREVILRRLLQLGFVTNVDYEQKVAQWNRDYLRTGSAKSGGNYYLTRLAYVGEGFARLAFRRYHGGHLTKTDLASHLNVNSLNIDRLEDFLGR